MSVGQDLVIYVVGLQSNTLTTWPPSNPLIFAWSLPAPSLSFWSYVTIHSCMESCKSQTSPTFSHLVYIASHPSIQQWLWTGLCFTT